MNKLENLEKRIVSLEMELAQIRHKSNTLPHNYFKIIFKVDVITTGGSAPALFSFGPPPAAILPPSDLGNAPSFASGFKQGFDQSPISAVKLARHRFDAGFEAGRKAAPIAKPTG